MSRKDSIFFLNDFVKEKDDESTPFTPKNSE
jgi:hypothetical protein